MKLSVIIELYATSMRVFTVDERQNYHELDITGGYGKKSIPLYMHYQLDEEQPLIGEDALLFDMVEKQFIHSAFESVYHFKMYFSVLIKKVKEISPEYRIDRLVFIFFEDMFPRNQFDHNLIRVILEIPVFWVNRLNCLRGYIEMHSVEPRAQYLYIDEGSLYLVAVDAYKFNTNRFKLPLTEIDDFYLNRLGRFFGMSEEDYRIVKLYETHKGLLHQGILTKKDSNVYSNLSFPPQKIKISYSEVFEFIRQWESEYSIEILTALRKRTLNSIHYVGTGHDLPIFKHVFGKNLKNMKIDEMAFVKGSIRFLETVQSDVIFNKGYSLYFNEERVELIRPMDTFTQHYRIELIVTGDVDRLELFESSLEGNQGERINCLELRPQSAVSIVEYSICFDLDQKVSEVYYEVRRA